MKTTLRTLIVITLFSLSVEGFSQKFGVKAGFNLSTLLSKDDATNFSDDYKLKPGFQFGPTVELELNDKVSFAGGLLLSNKGYRAFGEETVLGITTKFESTLNLYYIELPASIKGYVDLGNNKIFAEFGPCIGFGLGGTEKYKSTINGDSDTETTSVEWGSDELEDDLRVMDLGLNFGGGMEIGALQIGVSYNLGVANISSFTGDGAIIKNRVLALYLGYTFGEK